MHMDDIKLFAKNEKELETIYIVRIYSQDWEIEFGIEKCIMLVMKSGKQHMMEGVKSSNNQNAQRKGSLQILEDIGSWHYQTIGNERKN